MQYADLPRVADERTIFSTFLDWQRDTLARKCEGLSDEQLSKHAATPSTLTLLGLVRHMADVERGWFRRTLDAEDVPEIYHEDDDPDADFNNLESVSVEQAFASWREECERSRTIFAAHDLDDIAHRRDGAEVSMRWILTHMVEEYSRHNGHADLLRERIDGATGY